MKKMFRTEFEFKNLFFAQSFPISKETWALLGTCKVRYSETNRLFLALIDAEGDVPVADDLLVLPLTVLERPCVYELSSLGDKVKLEVGKMGDLSITLIDEMATKESEIITYSFCIPRIERK